MSDLRKGLCLQPSFWSVAIKNLFSKPCRKIGLEGASYDENVYIVYLLSPLTTTDFRISDGILKVVNAIIAFKNNNEKQTVGSFQRRRTYRVETRGQDAILSY